MEVKQLDVCSVPNTKYLACYHNTKNVISCPKWDEREAYDKAEESTAAISKHRNQMNVLSGWSTCENY